MERDNRKFRSVDKKHFCTRGRSRLGQENFTQRRKEKAKAQRSAFSACLASCISSLEPIGQVYAPGNEFVGRNREVSWVNIPKGVRFVKELEPGGVPKTGEKADFSKIEGKIFTINRN